MLPFIYQLLVCYSVLFKLKHLLSGRVIIGAPRSNSTHDRHKNIHEPGVLWQCFFEKKSDACRILTMDETGKSFKIS